jgi:hypothetical protein
VISLCVEDRAPRPAHLVTDGGVHQLDSTIRFSLANILPAPWDSPFRPMRYGTHALERIEVTEDSVLVHTSGGTVRLPASQVAYSFVLA